MWVWAREQGFEEDGAENTILPVEEEKGGRRVQMLQVSFCGLGAFLVWERDRDCVMIW